MNDWLTKVMVNPWIWAILSLLAVGSFIWGVYSHFSNKEKRYFMVSYASFEIVKQGKNAIDNIHILYKDNPISNLTVSKIALWNGGNRVINNSDIVPSQKLRLVAENSTEILEAQIISEVEPSNLFRIASRSAEKVELDFDYVSANEGIVIQILHTGSRHSLKSECKIKGGGPIRLYTSQSNVFIHRIANQMRSKTVLTAFMCIACILYFGIATLLTIPAVTGVIPQEFNMTNIKEVLILCIMMWMVTALMFSMVIATIRRVFLLGIPNQLKTYANSVYD